MGYRGRKDAVLRSPRPAVKDPRQRGEKNITPVERGGTFVEV